MEPGEYEALIARASTGSSTAAVDLLQSMRTNKIRQPELVVLHGGKLLRGSKSRLGAELWTVMEQVFIAALEVGSEDWRDWCLKQLTAQFPSSVRVERLKGMQQESMEQWPEAQKIYKKIIEDRPEDGVTRKRLIAMYKQRGRLVEAVEEMTKYLDTFSTDQEVWHELAEVYVDGGSLQRAAFCYEEMLVQNPRSLYHILTYAELCYSNGDYDLSRKYFSLAAYIDGLNLRALWGLAAVSLQLAEKDKTNEKMGQLSGFALDRLKHVYKGITGPQSQHGKLAMGLLTAGLS